MTDSWDKHFLRRARVVAGASKDPSSQIGAVLVKDRRQVSDGFNGFPPGIADDGRLHDRETKYRLVVHAEMNAILRAPRQDTVGATLYLWGFEGPPCSNCAKHLIAAGVTRIVASGTPTPARWADSLAEAEEILREAEVGLRYYPESEIEL